MDEITTERRIITISFTIDDLVKLLSCCNQAIINIEDMIREHGSTILMTSSKGITPQNSLEKIWEIKTKLKKSIYNSLGISTKNGISVTLDLTEWIKLNGCCNGAIEFEEKTLSLLPSTSKCIEICNESIQKIKHIKSIIKLELNRVYGNKYLY